MKKHDQPTLGIVVPCYNEEAVISSTATILEGLLARMIETRAISPESFIGLVDDGSKDKTWTLIEGLERQSKLIKAIKLAANRGHQNALLAGLLTFNAYADVLVSIDADLQDDITTIEKMVALYKEGSEIVYGVRAGRKEDSWFKKYSAQFFYRLLQVLGVSIIYNHADYRLTSKRVIEALSRYEEENLFLRGIFPSMGFQSATVHYDRVARKAGESKYTLLKMLAFAWEGVTSFSVKPLRLVTVVGLAVFVMSLLLSAYVIFSRFYLQVVPGWASIVLPIYLLGGIQLFAIGVLGEYLGKIYQEVKRRPRYIIDREI